MAQKLDNSALDNYITMQEIVDETSVIRREAIKEL